ncbi:MAG: hypothetical protein ACFLMY_14990 [Candidatus Brachytrichaceae bacterium NZ_4S206]|jgi:hypothetical protein
MKYVVNEIAREICVDEPNTVLEATGVVVFTRNTFSLSVLADLVGEALGIVFGPDVEGRYEMDEVRVAKSCGLELALYRESEISLTPYRGEIILHIQPERYPSEYNLAEVVVVHVDLSRQIATLLNEKGINAAPHTRSKIC